MVFKGKHAFEHGKSEELERYRTVQFNEQSIFYSPVLFCIYSFTNQCLNLPTGDFTESGECGVKWWVHGRNCHFCRHLQKSMCAHIHLQSAVRDGLAWKVFVICTSCMKVHLLFLFLFCFLFILKRRFKHRWVVLSPIRNGVWYWCDFMDLHTTQVTAALITTLSVLT